MDKDDARDLVSILEKITSVVAVIDDRLSNLEARFHALEGNKNGIHTESLETNQDDDQTILS